MDQALNSQKTPHTSPLRASYGMSFVSILMKNDRVIKGFYCISLQSYSGRIFPLAVNSSMSQCDVGISNSSPPGQNGCHFADDIFKCIFITESVWIFIQISLKFVPKGLIDNKAALVQVMAGRRTGDKPFPEPMLTQFTNAYMRH